jgi:hypothetical protein
MAADSWLTRLFAWWYALGWVPSTARIRDVISQTTTSDSFHKTTINILAFLRNVSRKLIRKNTFDDYERGKFMEIWRSARSGFDHFIFSHVWEEDLVQETANNLWRVKKTCSMFCGCFHNTLISANLYHNPCHAHIHPSFQHIWKCSPTKCNAVGGKHIELGMEM